jgi:hypothetical protein
LILRSLDVSGVSVADGGGCGGRELVAEEAFHVVGPGGIWNGSVWSGNGFSGSNWTPTTWTGRRWSGDGWSSAGWNWPLRDGTAAGRGTSPRPALVPWLSCDAGQLVDDGAAVTTVR